MCLCCVNTKLMNFTCLTVRIRELFWFIQNQPNFSNQNGKKDGKRLNFFKCIFLMSKDIWRRLISIAEIGMNFNLQLKALTYSNWNRRIYRLHFIINENSINFDILHSDIWYFVNWQNHHSFNSTKSWGK